MIMKKIYAFLAAALMSVSLFAALEPIPTESDLKAAGYLPNANVVLCIYPDTEGEAGVCNDIVLAGSYNGWSNDPTKCEKFEELDAFPGWWAVQVPFTDGLMAKPLQLRNSGDFGNNWDYQAGSPEAWVHKGGLAADVQPSGSLESNVTYGSAGAYMYEIKFWKEHNSPCVYIPKYKYTIYMLHPACPGEDWAPGILGASDELGWNHATPMAETFIELPEGHPADSLNWEEAYVVTFNDEAGHTVNFREVNSAEWANQLHQNENGGWKDYSDLVLPVPANGKDTILVLDYRDTQKYKYKQCGLVLYDITLIATLPANAPEIVELMGNFKDGVWDGTGVIMTKEEDGTYTAHIQGEDTNQFKFRSGVGSDDKEKWANQIYAWDDQTSAWKEHDNFTFGLEDWEEDDENSYICTVDLSDDKDYRWATEVPTGLENVVLTEKARKVVVNGQIYITRDNKLFNIHGAQLR